MEREKKYIKTILIDSDDEEALKDAAEHLRNGEVVGFPTETVYGLAGNGLNEESARKYRIIIHHYGNKETEVFKSEDGEIEFRRQGLCIRIDSFSPFVVEWEENVIPENLPHTGDHSALALYGMLLMISAAVLIAMRGIAKRA